MTVSEKIKDKTIVASTEGNLTASLQQEIAEVVKDHDLYGSKIGKAQTPAFTFVSKRKCADCGQPQMSNDPNYHPKWFRVLKEDGEHKYCSFRCSACQKKFQETQSSTPTLDNGKDKISRSCNKCGSAKGKYIDHGADNSKFNHWLCVKCYAKSHRSKLRQAGTVKTRKKLRSSDVTNDPIPSDLQELFDQQKRALQLEHEKEMKVLEARQQKVFLQYNRLERRQHDLIQRMQVKV